MSSMLVPQGIRALWVPLRLIAGAAALGAVLALAARGAEPFRSWTYQLAWAPLLVAVDAALALWPNAPAEGDPARGSGRGPLTGRPRFALSLFAWSVPVWLLFEAANFRLANWYYVNVPPERWIRWLGAAAAFATVLPAIFLAHAWLDRVGLARGLSGPRFEAGPRHRRALLLLGCLFVALAAWKPRLFYPLVWGAVTLLLEPFNHRRAPGRSLLGDLAAGRYARPVRLLAAGLLVGLVWELLNSFAGTRWIYTVHGLEGMKLFEMPLPGFLGFPVFAFDCFVLYQTLTLLGVAVPGWGGEGEDEPGAGGGSSARRQAAVAVAAGAFSVLVLAGIDRHTVDSVRPSLEQVPGIARREAEALRGTGVSGVEALARLTAREVAVIGGLSLAEAEGAVRFARLASLRGLGAINAYALLAAGVGTACDLAAAEPERVRRAVRAARADPHAGTPARVRVWLRAARERCQAEPAVAASGRRPSLALLVARGRRILASGPTGGGETA